MHIAVGSPLAAVRGVVFNPVARHAPEVRSLDVREGRLRDVRIRPSFASSRVGMDTSLEARLGSLQARVAKLKKG
jgi:hypothetical protein